MASMPEPIDPLRAAIRRHYLADETESIARLLPQAEFEDAARERIGTRARALIEGVRADRRARRGLDAFLHEYSLDTEEGVVLLCLAEALLRIPDAETADRLIEDRLASARWADHLGHSSSLFVNASTWALMLSGRLTARDAAEIGDLGSYLARLAARIGEPVVRLALREAMRILARQFILGRTLEEAIERARSEEFAGLRLSLDMLGEAALTRTVAERYFAAYRAAIDAIGTDTAEISAAPGISIKLSALHPRFEFAQGDRLRRELVPRVIALVEAARDAGVGVTIDAEEAERLEPALDVFERVYVYRALRDYEGFGLAVQAYQKRAMPVVEWAVALAERHRRRIPLRLVKGAYWDSEIKRAQERGLRGYPVYTRKAATDVCYLACARRMFEARGLLYPQFATHNAHTIAAILELAAGRRDFEFQRLHGMGVALYAQLVKELPDVSYRVYAPVGSHADLLPYLVRRLLENGANTSFLHHVLDEGIAVETLVADPAERLRKTQSMPNPAIPLPAQLYPDRKNSVGINFHDPQEWRSLERGIEDALAQLCTAGPIIGGETPLGSARPVIDPSDRRRVAGFVIESDATLVDQAYSLADSAHAAWEATPAGQRAAILERAAELIERDRATLIALVVREGGKCLPDADAEVREAADYCRYYARIARAEFAHPRVLPGPTGEHNELQWHGRGVFLCISPWNFPLAIFTGQIVAALAAGNCVIAKPARQTPLVAHAVVQLLHAAGVPVDVLHLLPGPSGLLSGPLLDHPRLSGVVFTGSTESGRAIHRRLAAREGPIVALIAETGGLNAMIADSSALPEQVVQEAMRSAFNSAGQRCSALRVLFVQKEIAPHVLELLTGAVEELSVGDPAILSTDIGPVIQESAKAALEGHAARMAREGRLLCRAPLPAGTEHGSFFAPCVFDIPRFDLLQREAFGPILHVVRYAAHEPDAVIEAINRSGYGLTLGIHSRIGTTARRIQGLAHVGNTYVNRNQIGAVVGVQPFGGEGLSGTGPKAGGPFYLYRFAIERTLTVNTAAIGGNAALLSQAE
jgi:RHH-type proline utilization regulon transcriptional repressor/proline dehydrogenase/delta 1-pyrroline-5-carboxylate dehydrogenase